ncbi:MAG: hypothetical protein AAGA65_09190 [Actinomycetota bacterium]
MVDVGTKNFQNEAIRITDLAVVTPVLEGYRFSNCSIHGPAVLIPRGEVWIQDCSWNAPGLDSIFWTIEPDREIVIGAIALVDTMFVGCRFDGIGIAGTADDKTNIMDGFGGS